MADSLDVIAEKLGLSLEHPYRAVSRSEMLLIDAHVRVELMRRAIRARLRLVAYFLKITGQG
jgi:hypothetical protein